MNIDRIDYLKKMIDDTPDDPFPPYALGMEFLLENSVKALEIFKSVQRKFPDYLPVYYQLAVLLEESGDEAQAIDVLKKGIELADDKRELKTKRELLQLKEEFEF